MSKAKSDCRPRPRWQDHYKKPLWNYIPIGSVIKTNYSDTIFRVTHISFCYCQGLDWIQRDDVVLPMQPHWHLACIDLTRMERNKKNVVSPDSWLGHYVEDNGRFFSIWNVGDEIYVLNKPEPVQALFNW